MKKIAHAVAQALPPVVAPHPADLYCGYALTFIFVVIALVATYSWLTKHTDDWPSFVLAYFCHGLACLVGYFCTSGWLKAASHSYGMTLGAPFLIYIFWTGLISAINEPTVEEKDDYTPSPNPYIKRHDWIFDGEKGPAPY